MPKPIDVLWARLAFVACLQALGAGFGFFFGTYSMLQLFVHAFSFVAVLGGFDEVRKLRG